MLLLRRVVGESMTPALRAGRIVAACGKPARIKPGDIVIIRHQGREKIKRVRAVAGRHIFVVGDNAAASTDSRQFGWLPLAAVAGRVWWPRA